MTSLTISDLNSILSRWRDLSSDEIASELPQGVDPEVDMETFVSTDAVNLSEDMIDKLIFDGALSPGSLNGCEVKPPRAQWPARWHFLQDPD